MKKILMLIVCVFIFTSCYNRTNEISKTQKNEDKDFNKVFVSSRFVKDIKSFSSDEKSENLYRAFCVVPIKIFERTDEIYVFLYMKNSDFSYKDGIFNEESGSSMPIRLKYKKEAEDYKLIDIIYPKDASEYYPSVKEMAENDEDAAKKAMDLTGRVSRELNDLLCEDLVREAQAKGLTDFTHKLEEIPGFKRDVIYIKSGPNHIGGTVLLASKSDYLEAKENKDNSNWPHCEGVIYNEKTGVSIKTIVDYFGE